MQKTTDAQVQYTQTKKESIAEPRQAAAVVGSVLLPIKTNQKYLVGIQGDILILILLLCRHLMAVTLLLLL